MKKIMKINQNQTNEEPVQLDRTSDTQIFQNNNPLLQLAEKLAEEREFYDNEILKYQLKFTEKKNQTALLENVRRNQERKIEQLKRDIEAKQAQQNH